MILKQAQKSQSKLKIGLSGASGFGKTYSALLLAFGITQDWSKIAIIDTENKSGSLYAHLGAYNALNLTAPYTPEKYVEAIKVCEEADMKVIIIDSISHEWNGKGGCLEIHEKLGGRFQDWAKVTPRHTSFIDAILHSQTHIITTVRRKMDYSIDQINNKTKVVKHGTKEVTREGFEYELTVNFELINENNLAKVSKDRTGLFSGKPEFVINSATGKKLMAWSMDDVSLDSIDLEIQQCTTVEGLKHIFNKYPFHQATIKSKILNKKALLEQMQSQLIETSNVTTNNKTQNASTTS